MLRVDADSYQADALCHISARAWNGRENPISNSGNAFCAEVNYFSVCDGFGFSAQGRKIVHSKYHDKEDVVKP